MQHDELQALFPEISLELWGALYLTSKKEVVCVGIGSTKQMPDRIEGE